MNDVRFNIFLMALKERNDASICFTRDVIARTAFAISCQSISMGDDQHALGNAPTRRRVLERNLKRYMERLKLEGQRFQAASPLAEAENQIRLDPCKPSIAL